MENFQLKFNFHQIKFEKTCKYIFNILICKQKNKYLS